MNKTPHWIDAFRGAVTARLLQGLSPENLSLYWELSPESGYHDLSLWILPNVLVDAEEVEQPRVRIPPYSFDFLGLREVFDDAKAFHLANIAEPLLDVDISDDESEDDRGVRLVATGTYGGRPLRFLFFAQRRQDRFGLVVRYRGSELIEQRDYDPDFDQGLFS